MDLGSVLSAGENIISKYSKDGFTVNNVYYPHSILICAAGVMKPPVDKLERLTPELLTKLFMPDQMPEIMVIGCGKFMIKLPFELRAAAKDLGIALEPMSTSAACRTYNILAGEGRNTAVLLLLGGDNVPTEASL